MCSENNHLISVIVPIYNRHLLADETIQSVFEQTYRPLELILVDDCSDAPYIPKILSQPGFKVIIVRHNKTKGPGAARETGRQVAKGAYIAYLDSDDLWHPEKLKKQVALLRENSEAGMCYCTSIEFTNLPITGLEKLRKRSDQSFKKFLPTIFYGRPWGTGACLWTRDATDRIGPWYLSAVWEDYEYDCRAGCHSIGIEFLPEVLCFYRKDHGEIQLSKSERSMYINNQTNAMFEIGRNLRKFSLDQNEDIRKGFYKVMYSQARHYFKLGEKQQGSNILKALLCWSTANTYILSSLLLCFSNITPGWFMGKIMTLLRPWD